MTATTLFDGKTGITMNLLQTILKEYLKKSPFNRDLSMERYTVPAGTSIGHVHLKIADLQRSLDLQELMSLEY